MGRILSANEYQDLASRTDPDRTKQVVVKIMDDGPNSSWLLHSQIGLAGEVGELAAAIQRWLYYGKPLDRTNVIEELGDLCWYLAQACRAMDIKLEDVMKANINKLLKRYPEKYTDFHAAEENRDRSGEREEIEQIGIGVTANTFDVSELPLPVIHSDFEFTAKEVKDLKSNEAYRKSCIQAMQSPDQFIASQTGPRPATPICPKCKTIISKHGYCPECKVRTV